MTATRGPCPLCPRVWPLLQALRQRQTLIKALREGQRVVNAPRQHAVEFRRPSAHRHRLACLPVSAQRLRHVRGNLSVLAALLRRVEACRRGFQGTLWRRAAHRLCLFCLLPT
eukprot:CAMPEP_0172052784 /NCGR_PEP_ID=MMETSP1043-20130122/3848_1 /TAXON_ID=464988 /ORGANISM="Hemiselmis andersenii, Strain CCMP441" /LENGTH=112 /DNA_ID=CAMNT_0012711971 /DNA_START=23 /DNA_END=357 /DNA_ORIENTATION=-